MADNTLHSTNTSALPAFNELGASDQAAVVWKSEGKNYSQIAGLLESQFDLVKSVETIRSWFRPSGRLQQAWLDYNDQLGDHAVREAIGIAKRGSNEAMAKMWEIMRGPDEALALKAAGMLAKKTIPDAHAIDLHISTQRSEFEPVQPGLKASIERQRAIMEAGEKLIAEREAKNESDN